MTIRLSQDLMKKLHLTIASTAEAAGDPLFDWALHLFRYQGRQQILATNMTSLFSVVLPGRGITDGEALLSRLVPALHEAHIAVGLGDAFESSIEMQLQEVVWSKVGNRSITGSMNEIIIFAQCLLDEELSDPAEFTRELNRNLLSVIKYKYPVDVHRQLVNSRSQ